MSRQGSLGRRIGSTTVTAAQVQVGEIVASGSGEGRVRLVTSIAGGGSRSWELGTRYGTGYERGFGVRDLSGPLPASLRIAYQAGNVGIGLVNATQKLVVAGGNVYVSETGNFLERSILGNFTLHADTENTTSRLIVGIRNQHNCGASVQFGYTGKTGAPGAKNTDSYIGFWTIQNGADGGDERIRIAPSGFVGIGTSSPGARLLVGDEGGLAPNAPGTKWLVSKDAGGSRRREISSDGSPTGWNHGFAIRDLGVNATRFLIDLYGNVGIGNGAGANPPVMLQVGNQTINGTRGLLRLGSYVEGVGSRTWELGPAEDAGMHCGTRDVIGEGGRA